MYKIKRLMPLLLVGILTMLGVFNAAAQESNERQLATVDAVNVEILDDGSVVLIVTGTMPTGCDDPLNYNQQFDGETLTITLFQVPSAAACPAIAIMFEERIEIGNPADYPGPFVVMVNDIEVSLDAPEAGPATDDRSRLDHIVNDVSLVRDPESELWVLEVTGMLLGQCDQQETVIEQHFSNNRFYVQIYRLVPPMTACTRDTPRFEEIIPLPNTFNVSLDDMAFDTVIEVNDYVGLLTASDSGPTLRTAMREMLTVENVNVQVMGDATPEIMLTIDGAVPDGCMYPIHARRLTNDTRLNIEIYRVIPENVVEQCAAVTQAFSIQRTFAVDWTDGVYPYEVNAIAGEMTIISMVRVPNLITDVQVRILESFPEQIVLVITGTIPDGCPAPTQVEVTRDGDVFAVEVYRSLAPEAVCPQSTAKFTEEVNLGGIGLGEYTFNINEMTVTMPE